MVGLVSEPAPAKTWRGTAQAEAIHAAIDAARMVYLTHRQVDVVLEALQAGRYLASSAAGNDYQRALRDVETAAELGLFYDQRDHDTMHAILHRLTDQAGRP